jgi:hypothetical protein
MWIAGCRLSVCRGNRNIELEIEDGATDIELEIEAGATDVKRYLPVSLSQKPLVPPIYFVTST